MRSSFTLVAAAVVAAIFPGSTARRGANAATLSELLADTVSVGTLPGTVRIDQIGGAAYQLPFDLPRGPGGHTPAVGIAYHSGAGNGLLGVGWSVTGLSAIEWCARDARVNGERTAYDWFHNEDADYCLDGVRLYRVSTPTANAHAYPVSFLYDSGEPGSTLREYRTRTNPRLRIMHNPGNGRWLVEHPDGRDRVYFPESSYASRGPWLVTEDVDEYGNAIHYHYGESAGNYTYSDPGAIDDGDHPGGRPRLERISYGDTDVLFHYAERPDPVRGFRDTAGASLSSLLAQVDVDYDGELVRAYKLSYDQGTATRRSRLTMVRMCAGLQSDEPGDWATFHTEVCVPPTVFHYTDKQRGFEDEVSPSLPAPAADYENPVRVGDFNGDGRDDVAIVVGSAGKLSIHVAFGELGALGAAKPSASALGSVYADEAGGGFMAVCDPDGNGRDDLVVQNGPGQFAVLGGNDGLDASAYYWNAFAYEKADEGHSIGFAACADFDGNGFDDVVTCEGPSEDELYYVLYASNGTALERKPTDLFCRKIGKQIIDATDDGVPDIVDLGFAYDCSASLYVEHSTYCDGFYDAAPDTLSACVQSTLACPCDYDDALLEESATFTCPDGTVCPIGDLSIENLAGFNDETSECTLEAHGHSSVVLTAGGTPGGALHYRPGGFSGGALGEDDVWETTRAALGAVDLNGDGLVDPLFWRDGSELEVQFGTGAVGVWPRATLDSFTEFNAGRFTLADWDSDGRADMLVATNASSNLFAATWALTGTSDYAQADVDYVAFEDTGVPYAGSPTAGDFNGDGMVDILMCDGCSPGGAPTSRWHLYFNRRTTAREVEMRAPPDYLAEIRDGYGRVQRIAYRPYADDDAAEIHCASDLHCTCPAQTSCRLPRRPVVGRYEVVGVATLTYAYRGALADRLTGRSLGVAEHEARRHRGASEDWVTLTEYRNAHYEAGYAAFPYVGQPWRTTVWQGTGPQTPRHAYTQTVSEHWIISTAALHPAHLVPGATSAFFVWPGSVETSTYELDEAVTDVAHLSWGEPLTVTEYTEERDEYGNYTASLTQDDVGQRVSTVSYAPNVAHWLVARPELAIVVGSSGGDSRTRRVRYEYDGPASRPYAEHHDEDEPSLTYRVYYGRDGHGNVDTVRKTGLLLEREWTTTWDACEGAFPSRRTNPMGHAAQLQWDCAHGVMTRSSDDNGVGWTTLIDAFGRPLERIEQDSFGAGSGRSLTVDYERAGGGVDGSPSPMRVRRRVAGGAHDWVEADEHGRPIQIGREIAGQASLRDIAYDGLGRAVEQTLPYWEGAAPAAVWTTSYDNRDRVVRVSGPEGYELGYEYVGLTRTGTDADGRTREVVSDSRGRAVSAVNAPGTVDESSVCYEYGGLDQLVRVALDCDAAEPVEIRRLSWDAGAYRVTSVHDEVSGTSEVKYNAFGEPVRHVDGDGRTSEYVYNDLGQMIERKRRDGEGYLETEAEWEYAQPGEPWLGPPGVLAESKVWSGGVPGPMRSHRWDAYGRAIRDTLTWDGHELSTTWDYDDAGRVEAVHVSSDDTLPTYGIGYNYDSSGDVIAVYQIDPWDVVWARFGVDATGQPTKDVLGNGVERRIAYDDMGRVELLQSSPQPWPALAWWAPSLLQTSNQYLYTPAGELDRHTDHATGQYERYDYDLAGRLTGILTSTLDETSQSTQTFAYDEFNNFVHKDGAAVTATPGGRVVTAGSRAYEHDGAGNVIAITAAVVPGGLAGETPDLPVQIQRTVSNQMARVEAPDQTVSYRYDANDIRVESAWEDSGERWLHHGPYTRIATPKAVRHRYDFPLGPGLSLVVNREQAIGGLTWTDGKATSFVESVRYVVSDLRGSPIAITDETGALVERRSFGNWGAPRDPYDWTGTAVLDGAAVPDGFTGMPVRTVSGLVDFDGRWLDSTAGVMLEPDPLVVDPLDPMSQNATMFGPGPLTIDPTGFAEVQVNGGTSPAANWFAGGFAAILMEGIVGMSPAQLREIGGWLADLASKPAKTEHSWVADELPDTQMSLAGSAWSYVTDAAGDYVPDVVQEFAVDARDTVGQTWWNVGSGLWDGTWNMWWGDGVGFQPVPDTREAIFSGWTEYDSDAYQLSYTVGSLVQFAATIWEAGPAAGADGTVVVFAKGGTAVANQAAKASVRMPRSNGVLGPLAATKSNPAMLARVRLPKALHEQTRSTHFREANRMLYEKMQSDPSFRASLSKKLREFLKKCAGPKNGMCDGAPEGYVWHHNVSPGAMQLIKSRVHWSKKWWDWLHPIIDGKNRGGFSVWGGG